MGQFFQTNFYSSLENIENIPFRYIEKGIKAKGHSRVYKMHKYFARRPHNVFRYLIESYTAPGETVLDCFCGGGVTLFEGLAVNRKVVCVDINPLATFISASQATPVSIEEYQKIVKEVWTKTQRLTQQYYSTACRECGKQADVRWYELAYTVRCSQPYCGQQTLLSNDNKLERDGKQINGRYVCQHCSNEIIAVDADREGYQLLSVTYKCPCTKGRQTVKVNEEDLELMQLMESCFEQLINEYRLWYPKDEIPEQWDRQQEDCLHRKAVTTFADFFTKRSLFFNAYILKCFQEYRDRVSPELYRVLLFTFSAIIRHTNNMTFSTGNWMDGRPVSWAKHAYWIPNQFVEVNPLEYVEKRRNAIVSGLKFQQSQINGVRQVDSFADLQQNKGTHIVWTRSSANLDIPDESIDAIVTDPPYGSNVQYGELSHFWLVWLRDELSLTGELFGLENEILVHRKTDAPNRKEYDDYYKGLLSVFSEGFRVLKPGGVLAFTFNNKDLKVWFSVIKSAIQAGFYLDPRGVIYQEPIENYKNTAHTRYAGSLHGDFIYTFRKLRDNDSVRIAETTSIDETTLREEIVRIASQYLTQHEAATTNELYICVLSNLIPVMVRAAETDEEFAQLNTLLELENLDGFLAQYFEFRESNKLWYVTAETSETGAT